MSSGSDHQNNFSNLNPVRIPKEMRVESIYLEVETGVYDRFQSVVYGSLCQMNVVQSSSDISVNAVDDYWADTSECPHPGSYLLTTYYTVPTLRDYNFHYTPDVRLTFTNPQGRRIGCVLSGPSAIHRYNEQRSIHGLAALGLSLLAFLCIFGSLLHLSHMRKKRLEYIREKRNLQRNGSHYQYYRTMPDGRVARTDNGQTDSNQRVPEPRQLRNATLHSEVDDDEDSDDALNISNPEYNETHVPTRPII